MIAYKLVKEDYGSLRDEGRIIYGTEWQEVPGNGAYCSETGEGITDGGVGPVLIRLEVKEPTSTNTPDGVACWRWVRRVGVVDMPDGWAEAYRAWAEADRAWAEAYRALAEAHRAWVEAIQTCEQIVMDVIREEEP